MALNGNINMFASLGKLNEIDETSKAENKTETQPVKESKKETKRQASTNTLIEAYSLFLSKS